MRANISFDLMLTTTTDTSRIVYMDLELTTDLRNSHQRQDTSHEIRSQIRIGYTELLAEESRMDRFDNNHRPGFHDSGELGHP